MTMRNTLGRNAHQHFDAVNLPIAKDRHHDPINRLTVHQNDADALADSIRVAHTDLILRAAKLQPQREAGPV